MINIRRETEADWDEVETLTREAFWNTFVPGCDEHYLAHIMRAVPEFIPELDLVAEMDGKIVGNIMYTHAHIEAEDGTRHGVVLFGPLSVLPAYQSKGVGGALIRQSADIARDMGFDAVVIMGDPLYYSRHGFRPASEFGIVTAEGKLHPALQVLPLREGALTDVKGRLIDAPVYQVDAEAAAAFDKKFPPKEKGFKESQRRFAELAGIELDV